MLQGACYLASMRIWQCILIMLLAGSALWAGCGKRKDGATSKTPATNQTVLVELEPWEVRAKELKGIIKDGMSEDEVFTAAGDPKMVRTSFGDNTAATWQYELGAGNWFNVQFNKSNRVDSAGLESLVKPQN